MNDHLPPWKALMYEYAAKAVFYPIAITGAALVWLAVALFAGVATLALIVIWPLAWLVSLVVSTTAVDIRK